MPYIVRTRTRSGRSSPEFHLLLRGILFFFFFLFGGREANAHAHAGFLGKAAKTPSARAGAEN